MNAVDPRVLGLLKDARRQLELERERRTGAIAIVGMGCRFPGGASSLEAYFQLLEAGVDATSEVPRDRWDNAALYDPDPAASGKVYVQRGGFLPHIDGFDCDFFGISPREAQGMDPQQRLLLEVTWEALEDARIEPSALSRTATGVWVGVCLDDYSRRSIGSGDLARIDAYSALGNTRSIAAGRIAYVLDLRGPAVQLDTACSSSLVAVHQACQSLRAGETDLALAGGVNLMCAPESMVALCRLRALSPDGRCKTFDASADGYGRGEGCGVVVLERLADAMAHGHRVHAVIRGTAANHDGRSNGLTAPNGSAQEAVIRAALESGELEPRAISYVEAHGTGTLLGDPIEVLSLARVYGAGRSKSSPLRLGSVKTNFGHLEGAAGVAGLIKVALCLSKRRWVPHLNVQTPNPRIPWAELPLEIVAQPSEWPSESSPRLAGLSSFGLSGTNAHAIVSEAPAADDARQAPLRARELCVLSARSAEALDAQAARLLEHVSSRPEVPLADVARSLATTRTAFEHRLAIVAASPAGLCDALTAVSSGETPAGAVRAEAGAARGQTCWLFTGQGAQRAGMGQPSYAAWPVFRDALDAALAELNLHLERPLQALLWAAPDSPEAALLDETAYTQPAMFALQWALAALWRSFGVQPDLLVGHSIGEIAAACVANVLSLRDAARLVCARGRLMQQLPRGGAMFSIAAPDVEVAAALEEHAGFLSIAAVNGPSATVISGEELRASAVAQRFAERGASTQRLPVSHAFHSPLMDSMLGELRRVAETLELRPPELPIISSSTGTSTHTELATAEYWVTQVRETVRFEAALKTAAQAGASQFIELGPSATLLHLLSDCLPNQSRLLLPSLRRGRHEMETMLQSLGAWFAHGGSVNWQAAFAPGAALVDLPTYGWQRQRFWMEAARNAPADSEVLAADRRQSAAPPAGPWFTLRWAPVEAPALAQPRGKWLVIALDASDAAERLCAQLSARGAAVKCVPLEQLAKPLVADHVVCTWPAANLPELALRAAKQALAVVQRLSAARYAGRLWWLTERAIATRDADDIAPAGAAIWGLGRTVTREHPELRCSLLDVDELDALPDSLLGEAVAVDAEDQVVWRGGRRYRARLERILTPPAPGSRPWRSGTALITGGSGALAALVARRLAREGVRHLLLLSRRGSAAPDASQTRAALEALGARVTLAAVDVTDRAELGAVLAALPADLPLRAVIHAAGEVDDAALREQTPERFERVMAPKVIGAHHLDQLTRGSDLDAFILFSSLAGTLGSPGQGAYAAANAFLDALALQRRKGGLPGLSLAWGPWAEQGMAAGLESSFARRGLRSLTPELALDCFSAARQARDSPLIVADFDLSTLARQFGASVPPIWRSLIHAPAKSDSCTENAELLTLPLAERSAAIIELLRVELARVLSVRDPKLVSLQKPLAELGLDSLMAVELRSAITRRTGVLIPATLLNERPTLFTLERCVSEALGAQSAASPPGRARAALAAEPERAELRHASVAQTAALKRLEAPQVRLFCFHDAGGAAELFTPLVQLEAMGVEVHTVSHARTAPPDTRRADRYLQEAATYIFQHSDLPYALLGHSLGGLMAWRLARELASGERPPILLAVSAIDPKGLETSLADSDLKAAFFRIFGDRAQSVPHLERDFIADMQLWQMLPKAGLTPLEVPIAAFAGREDHVANEATMREWSSATRGDFSLAVLPGNHFYLSQKTAQGLFVRALAAVLMTQLSAITRTKTAGHRSLSVTQHW